MHFIRYRYIMRKIDKWYSKYVNAHMCWYQKELTMREHKRACECGHTVLVDPDSMVCAPNIRNVCVKPLDSLTLFPVFVQHMKQKNQLWLSVEADANFSIHWLWNMAGLRYGECT